jgi:hypothetical protein
MSDVDRFGTIGEAEGHDDGPPMSLHQWTGNGPGVIGADNCQVCNRWSDEPETPTCRDRLDMEPGK